MIKTKKGIASTVFILLVPLALSYLSPSIFGVFAGLVSRNSEAVSNAISKYIAYILAFNYVIAFCIALLRMKKQGVAFCDVGVSKKSFNVKHIFLAVILGIGCFVFLNLLPDILGIYKQTSPTNSEGGFMFFVSSITLAPIAEEFIFRGYGISLLKGKLPVWATVLIPSVCFSLIHIYMGVANVIWALVAGIILSIFFLKTKNCVACMIAHFCMNFSIGLMYAVIAFQ
ncbi:MAG: CPBP family intramembrane metalloprotease [Clostridiales bacterium]|jgi:membrane protease YdiL (CAAX protease family)|nr:CPBP family intramembrane metalloprotease [Clostridiales bacterium]